MKGGNGKVAYIDTEGTLYPCCLFSPLINTSSSISASLYYETNLENAHFTLFVFYLTKFTFSRPDRIVPIAERFGMDAGAVLDNVNIFLNPLVVLLEPSLSFTID